MAMENRARRRMSETERDALVSECWKLGRTGRSRSAFRQAQRLLASAQISRHLRAEAELQNQIGWFSLQLGLAEEGRMAATEARRLWDELGDLSKKAEASGTLSWLLVEMGLVEEGFAEASVALDLAEGGADREVLAYCRNTMGIAQLYRGQGHLALPQFEGALRGLEGVEAPWLKGLLLVNMGYAQTAMAEASEKRGERGGAEDWRRRAVISNDQAIVEAANCGDIWTLRTALCNGAEYNAYLGDMETAEEYLTHWQALKGETGLREEMHFLFTRGEILSRSGRLGEALETCQEAADLADAHGHADHQAATHRRLSAGYEAAGDYRAALEELKLSERAYRAHAQELAERRARHMAAKAAL
jgi:diguanylate cyclase